MNVLAYGGIVALIGMLIVFLGLTILICFVWLMGKVFQAITKGAEKKAAAKAAAAAAAAAEAAPAPVAEAPVVEEPAVDDAQLIAAALEMLAGKRDSKPAKKHGNMPL